ncbi:MAG: hypothetical protein G01um101413_762 [Parcubacteria group bacterium Gr01-1014_13]|nr:MAG: hypothetical protein G01um101413_762 [Parcubacteria group bacterium Gr01-1014_13]
MVEDAINESFQLKNIDSSAPSPEFIYIKIRSGKGGEWDSISIVFPDNGVHVPLTEKDVADISCIVPIKRQEHSRQPQKVEDAHLYRSN